MTPRKARSADLTPAQAPPLAAHPDIIVAWYPNPEPIIRAYVESEFARTLALEHERLVAMATAEGAAVTDASSYRLVGEQLVNLVEHKRAVQAWFKPLKQWADRLHSMICARETAVLAPIATFEMHAKANRLRLEREEAEARRAEEQRLAELARAEERERLTREAADLEQRNELALAAVVLQQAIEVAAPVIVLPSILPATKGVSSTPNYQWRPAGGNTPEARARAVRLVPREYLTLDDRALTAYAKAHGTGGKIPGIEFFDAGTVRVRT